MARRNFQSTDLWRFLDWNWPTVGTSQFTASTTCTIALATIEATDVVNCQVQGYTTSAYVISYAITAGTGFIVTVSATTDATITYSVFKVNS